MLQQFSLPCAALVCARQQQSSAQSPAMFKSRRRERRCPGGPPSGPSCSRRRRRRWPAALVSAPRPRPRPSRQPLTRTKHKHRRLRAAAAAAGGLCRNHASAARATLPPCAASSSRSRGRGTPGPRIVASSPSRAAAAGGGGPGGAGAGAAAAKCACGRRTHGAVRAAGAGRMAWGSMAGAARRQVAAGYACMRAAIGGGEGAACGHPGGRGGPLAVSPHAVQRRGAARTCTAASTEPSACSSRQAAVSGSTLGPSISRARAPVGTPVARRALISVADQAKEYRVVLCVGVTAVLLLMPWLVDWLVAVWASLFAARSEARRSRTAHAIRSPPARTQSTADLLLGNCKVLHPPPHPRPPPCQSAALRVGDKSRDASRECTIVTPLAAKLATWTTTHFYRSTWNCGRIAALPRTRTRSNNRPRGATWFIRYRRQAILLGHCRELSVPLTSCSSRKHHFSTYLLKECQLLAGYMLWLG